MACAMEQESRIAFTALIIVGTQACQHFDSGILVVLDVYKRQDRGRVDKLLVIKRDEE